MSLITDFSHKEAALRKSIYIYDRTGIYNPTTNQGGFGTPNPEVGDATADVITIQAVGSDLVYILNAYPTLPNVIGAPFEIKNTDIGLDVTAEIPDGQYVIIRTTTVSGFDYVRKRRIMLVGQLECCVENCIATEPAGCPCESGQLTKGMRLYYVMQTMRKAFNGLKYEKANQIYLFAKSLCDDKFCKNC